MAMTCGLMSCARQDTARLLPGHPCQMEVEAPDRCPVREIIPMLKTPADKVVSRE